MCVRLDANAIRQSDVTLHLGEKKGVHNSNFPVPTKSNRLIDGAARDGRELRSMRKQRRLFNARTTTALDGLFLLFVLLEMGFPYPVLLLFRLHLARLDFPFATVQRCSGKRAKTAKTVGMKKSGVGRQSGGND